MAIATVSLFTFALLFLTASVYSYSRMSATWDEPIHVLDGFASLARGDYRIDPEHPPLLRMYAMLPFMSAPLSVALDQVDNTDPDGWALARVFDYTHDFMYRDNDADALLYPARFMVVLLGVLLGALVFFWAYEWLAAVPAVLALAFVLLEPNLLAHFSLVTTDGAITCLAFATVYALWRWVRRPSALNEVGVIAPFSLALVTKFTAALLVPIVLLLLTYEIIVARRVRLVAAARILGLLALAGWITVWAVYGFRYAPSASESWLYHFHDNPYVVKSVPTLSRVVAWIDARHLVPNVYSQGFLIGQAKAQARSAFLAGQYSETGWWYFFPVAVSIKTPISLLVLCVIGLAALAQRRRTGPGHAAVYVLLPIVVFLGAAMTARINIGLRHVLTIYPFLILLGAAGAERLLRMKTAGIWALAFLVAFWSLEAGRAYPHTLAFFNAFVGGPRNGAQYLVDSNLDWGQELKALKGWMDANHVRHVNLAYFGSADPDYYGINSTLLNGSPSWAAARVKAPVLPGYVAISATILSGTYVDEGRRSFYAPFARLTPTAVIGHSISVYWVEQPWW
jgi:hypothetical protein